MNNKEVSIIITVYNVEKYLRQCLDSVITQTFKDTEIIIVNDCSTDNCHKIIEEYQKKDARIFYINLPENIGVGFARNEGMKAAGGKYITFVDSDDWITNDYIEVLHKNIEKYNCDFICANFSVYDENKKTIKLNQWPEQFCNTDINSKKTKQQLLVSLYIWSAWSKIYKNSFLKNNNIKFRINKYEDVLFIYEIMLISNEYFFIGNNLYYYRINRSFSLTYDKKEKIYSFINLIKEIKKLLIEKQEFDNYANSFYTHVILFTALEIEVSKLPFKELQKILLNIKKEFLPDKKFIPIHIQNKMLRIRLKLVLMCLKYNINYAFISKLCKKINFIKLLKNIYN